MKALILTLASTLIFVLPAAGVAAENKIESAAHPTNFPHRHVRRVRHVKHPRHVKNHHGSAGLYMGIGGIGNFFLDTGSDIGKVYKGGGGFSLLGGLRFNRYGAFEMNYFASFLSTQEVGNTKEINQGSLQSVGFDGKIFLAPHMKTIEPFFQIGIGLYMLSENLQHKLNGAGIHAGGGVDVRVSPFAALGVKLMYRGFHVDNSEQTYTGIPTESAFLSTMSLDANVTFHF